MKIVIICPTILPLFPQRGDPEIARRCPNRGYGGLEPIAWEHANGLVRRGHEVLLIAPIGSNIPVGCQQHGTTLGEHEKQSYSGHWQRLLEGEVIIDHSWMAYSYFLKAEGRLKAPILKWLHAPVETMMNTAPPVQFPGLVAISEDQARACSERLGVQAKVCYHGVDSDNYKPLDGAVRDDRYLFLARFSAIKGADIAIQACRKARVGLDLVGDDSITGDPQYVQRIHNACDGIQFKYIGPVPRDECVKWYSTKKAYLLPIERYREPFGLSVVEAMLCGCVPIVWKNGSMPELVQHGETGFLVKSLDEMADLIKTNAVNSIDRVKMREYAMQKFSISRMIDRVEVLMAESLKEPW